MNCANCEHNDGMLYTSLPPRYKCTITNEFHLGGDSCNVEFAPVKHGRWEKKGISIKGIEKEFCSECKTWSYGRSKMFCPNCGARCDL